MKKILFIFTILFINVINVKALDENIIKINLKREAPFYNESVFEVTDLETSDIYRWTTVEDYTEIHLPKTAKKVSLKETACDYHFICNKEEYNIDFTESDVYEVNFTYKIKYVNVNYKAFYKDKTLDELKDEYFPSISIYDQKLNYLKSEENSNFQIAAGEYVIKDDLYDKYYFVVFTEEENEIILTQNLIDGLVVNEEIKSICTIDKCYEFDQDDSIIKFPKQLIPGKYLINGQEFNLNENMPHLDYDKFFSIIINLSKEEERIEPDIPQDEVISDENENIEPDQTEVYEDVLVNVPNTCESILRVDYTYVEKKYYYC